MNRYYKARHSCPRCEYSWASEIPTTIMNLRKVDFFWINRDQRSFEWFVNLLSQLEIEQAELGGAMERFLDMVSFTRFLGSDSNILLVSAHVHHVRTPANRHESCESSTGVGLAARKRKARFDHRLENSHHCRSSKLGQSVQEDSRPEKRKSHRLLLWPAATRKNSPIQMWTIWFYV